MASDDANQAGKAGKDKPGEAELSERLRQLEERLGAARAEEAADAAKTAAQGSDASGLGSAMRLSTEFIAGVIAGAGLGWVVDRLLGTSPWGFIILLLLGFVAGIMNAMRSAGMLGTSPGKKKQ
jgi:ATP synthase protein I